MADNQQQFWLFEVFGTDPEQIGFFGNAGIIIPRGTTAERPSSPVDGHIRLNTDSVQFEAFFDGIWQSLGSGGSGGTFIGQTDTPGTYVGQGNKVLRVNSGATDVEFSPVQVLNSGAISVAGITNYENLVTGDDVIPNRKYVQDQDALRLALTGGTVTGNITMSGATVTGLPTTPVGSTDAASKAYVDSISAGLDPKESVRLATTSAITLSGNQSIDGFLTVDGDRILVKNQGSAADNGIYIANAGAWTRSTDQDGTPANEASGGNFTFVEEGTANAGTGWVVVWDGLINVGVDPMNWTQFSGGGGAFLPLAGGTMSGSIVMGAPGVQFIGDVSGAPGTPPFTFAGDTLTGIHQLGVPGTINFVSGGAANWSIAPAPGAFLPATTLTHDIGSMGLKIANFYGDHHLMNFGAAGDPSYSFEGDTNTGMYNGGGDILNFATAGTLRFIIEADGTLSVPPGTYENLVTNDDVIPNKKFVDDAIAAVATYVTVAGDSGSATASTQGETVSLIGATSGGITTVGSDGPDQVTFGITPIDLVTGGATLATGDFIIVSDAADGVTTLAQKYTFGDVITDLGLSTQTLTASEGVQLVADDIQLDINGLGDLVAFGTFPVSPSPGTITVALEDISAATSGHAKLTVAELLFRSIKPVADSGIAISGQTIGGINDVLGVELDLTTIITADDTLETNDFFAYQDVSAGNLRTATFGNLFENLDVPHGITSNGFVVRTADDTYASRSIVVSGPGNEDGLSITDGDGVSGNPTIGLDIVGNALAGEDVATGDLFLLYNASSSANEAFTLAEVAAGISTELTINNTLLVDDDLDTRIQVEEGTDDDTIRFDVGDSPAGYGAVQDILTLSSAGFNLSMGTADSGTNGAPIELTAGTGGAGGVGGLFRLIAGSGDFVGGNTGGTMEVSGGTSPGGGTGGNASLSGGPSLGVGIGVGGNATVAGGTSANGTGGEVSIISGIGNNSGSVNISTPNAVNGTSGAISITTGDSVGAGNDAGDITIAAGDGNPGGENNGEGGDVLISAGNSDFADAGGIITLTAGTGGSTGDGGGITITAGNGGSTSGDGADINLNAGNADGSGSGGDVNINAGAGASPGGAINLTAGNSTSTDIGGPVNITAGNGGPNDGNGGVVVITAGDGGATNSNGGDIELRPGSLAGTGMNGVVRVIGPAIGSAGAIRLEDNTGGQFVSIEAPATVPTSHSLILPAAPASVTNAPLVSDTSGNLSFGSSAVGTVRKFAQDNATTSTSEQFTHSLGTTDVIVQVYDLTTSPATQFVPGDIEIDDANNVTITVAIAPGGAGEYRVVITG